MNWHAYPPDLRSYINSEQEKDIERAMEYCKQYGLDYQQMRKLIIAEMVADYDANEPARAKRRTAKGVTR